MRASEKTDQRPGSVRMREFLEKRARRITDPTWFVTLWMRVVFMTGVLSLGMDDSAADMAEHDPDLYRACYGDDPDKYLKKYRRDQERCAALRERFKGFKLSARIME